MLKGDKEIVGFSFEVSSACSTLAFVAFSPCEDDVIFKEAALLASQHPLYLARRRGSESQI